MKYLNQSGLSYFYNKIKNLLIGKEDNINKVTSLSSSSTNSQYPSAKCVYDLVGNINTVLATLTTVGGGN